MLKKSIAIAYPTIPIIFLGGINPNRIPLYDTMGLAVTDQDNKTRTETSVEILCSSNENAKPLSQQIDFYIGENQITNTRGTQIIAAIKSFLQDNMLFFNLKVNSNNYQIYSGSSDSGMAALFSALDNLFNLNNKKETLLRYAILGSESAGRSLYGGLTYSQVINNRVVVKQLSPEQELQDIRLFAIPFHYDTRISADDIHAAIVTNKHYIKRVKKIPFWVKKIITAIKEKDYISMFQAAEENIRNAHELLEAVGIFVRKPEMVSLCEDIEKMRLKGVLGYYLIGGGNLVTIASTTKYQKDISQYLTMQGWTFYSYKVAGSPQIVNP